MKTISNNDTKIILDMNIMQIILIIMSSLLVFTSPILILLPIFLFTNWSKYKGMKTFTFIYNLFAKFYLGRVTKRSPATV